MSSNLAPYRIQSPFGSVQTNKRGATFIGDAPGTELAPAFNQFAAQALQQAGATPTSNVSFTPDQLFAAAMGAGSGARAQYNAAADPFLQAGGNFAASLAGFDPNAFAMEQFERLNALAAPGEATQASSEANRLFMRGRLGANDTASGEVFRNLDLSQRMARDNRLLQSLGLARDEIASRVGAATGLSGQGLQLGVGGEQIATSQLAQLLGGAQGAQGLATFQNQLREMLVNQALQGQQGGIGAFQNLKDVLQLTLGQQVNATSAQQAGQQARMGWVDAAARLGGSAITAFGTPAAATP